MESELDNAYVSLMHIIKVHLNDIIYNEPPTVLLSKYKDVIDNNKIDSDIKNNDDKKRNMYLKLTKYFQNKLGEDIKQNTIFENVKIIKKYYDILINTQSSYDNEKLVNFIDNIPKSIANIILILFNLIYINNGDYVNIKNQISEDILNYIKIVKEIYGADDLENSMDEESLTDLENSMDEEKMYSGGSNISLRDKLLNLVYKIDTENLIFKDIKTDKEYITEYVLRTTCSNTLLYRTILNNNGILIYDGVHSVLTRTIKEKEQNEKLTKEQMKNLDIIGFNVDLITKNKKLFYIFSIAVDTKLEIAKNHVIMIIKHDNTIYIFCPNGHLDYVEYTDQLKRIEEIIRQKIDNVIIKYVSNVENKYFNKMNIKKIKHKPIEANKFMGPQAIASRKESANTLIKDSGRCYFWCYLFIEYCIILHYPMTVYNLLVKKTPDELNKIIDNFTIYMYNMQNYTENKIHTFNIDTQTHYIINNDYINMEPSYGDVYEDTTTYDTLNTYDDLNKYEANKHENKQIDNNMSPDFNITFDTVEEYDKEMLFKYNDSNKINNMTDVKKFIHNSAKKYIEKITAHFKDDVKLYFMNNEKQIFIKNADNLCVNIFDDGVVVFAYKNNAYIYYPNSNIYKSNTYTNKCKEINLVANHIYCDGFFVEKYVKHEYSNIIKYYYIDYVIAHIYPEITLDKMNEAFCKLSKYNLYEVAYFTINYINNLL